MRYWRAREIVWNVKSSRRAKFYHELRYGRPTLFSSRIAQTICTDTRSVQKTECYYFHLDPQSSMYFCHVTQVSSLR